MINELKILSLKEENKLSKSEREEYYLRLKNYAANRRLEVTTRGALTVAPKLKGITNKLAKGVTRLLAGGKYTKTVKGLENIPEGAVIFASTHQGILDGFVWIPDCPKHALVVHSRETNKALLMAQLNTGLILVTKNKKRANERISAKLDMMTVLEKGHSIYICPETAWNLSPNKLHLPINYGFIDVAKKTGVPIIPLMINYGYDVSNEKERITQIDICYGKPIYVSQDDEVLLKLNEYSEAVSTMRYAAIEKNGIFKRSTITNIDYINFLKGNLDNLKLGKIDINVENAGIQNSQDEFYVFNHINNVAYDENGRLLDTKEKRRIKKISAENGIYM